MESGVLGCDDIAVMALDIFSPLNLATTILHNFNRFTIRDAREGEARDFDGNRVLVLACAVGVDGFEEV